MFGQEDRISGMKHDAVTESAADKLAGMIANMPPEFRDYLMSLLRTMEEKAEPVDPTAPDAKGPGDIAALLRK